MRSLLLTLHLLTMVVWLGAGLYDLLLREIRQSAGGGGTVHICEVGSRTSVLSLVRTENPVKRERFRSLAI
jgi:hypothetical protein